MNTQLKPCPFCGHEAYIRQGNYWEDSPANRMPPPLNIYYNAQCSDCDASITDFDTREQAIEAWNKRVSNE